VKQKKMTSMFVRYRLYVGAMLGVLSACSSGDRNGPDRNGSGRMDGGIVDPDASAGSGGTGGQPAIVIDYDGGGGKPCEPQTCAELGYACGQVFSCGTIVDCADEGLACGDGEVCVGGRDAPTQCLQGGGPCEVCPGISECSGEPQLTRLTGRVITPGRNDAESANQIGVPNATVYILRSNDEADLPAITSGIPIGGTSCDRCEDQDLGAVLAGAVTDATGHYQLEGQIPVGREFLLVVKAGKFRRAVHHTLPDDAACKTTDLPPTLPGNPTRLPRSMTDGVAVNVPRIAITTGKIDAMECVFEKMGIADGEFGNPGSTGSAAQRIHLYRGGPNAPGKGAYFDANTPHDSVLYGDLQRMQQYDMVVSDCEGEDWDSTFTQRDTSGARVREYVNRGGRMFASHLSFSWLHLNGSQAYSESQPIETGLGPAAMWYTAPDVSDIGTGAVSVARPLASARIQNFADWTVNEGITQAPTTPPRMPEYAFTIDDPRSQNQSIGDSAEEFLYGTDGTERVQQFSFNTPYGAPSSASCGRVAYSGFHVAAMSATNPYANSVFPTHCSGSGANNGNLTKQEKVLLYMLFDLGACVGVTPTAPECVPLTCGDLCGYPSDGCGNVLDCGPCLPG
jgi:hypothetical protein